MWWDIRRDRSVKLGESITKHTTMTNLLNRSAGVLLLQIHILHLVCCINSVKVSLYRAEKMGHRSRVECILGLLIPNQKLCSQLTARRSSTNASDQIKFAQNIFKRYLSYKRLYDVEEPQPIPTIGINTISHSLLWNKELCAPAWSRSLSHGVAVEAQTWQ